MVALPGKLVTIVPVRRHLTLVEQRLQCTLISEVMGSLTRVFVSEKPSGHRRMLPLVNSLHQDIGVEHL